MKGLFGDKKIETFEHIFNFKKHIFFRTISYLTNKIKLFLVILLDFLSLCFQSFL
jgi:hypothetical protein